MFKRKAIREYVYDKVYDTSVAKKVITYIEIKSKYCKCEIYSLYKGEKEWFLLFKRQIIPIAPWKAKEILAKHDIDKYVEYFGEVTYA